jgi:hypothetical protein
MRILLPFLLLGATTKTAAQATLSGGNGRYAVIDALDLLDAAYAGTLPAQKQ